MTFYWEKVEKDNGLVDIRCFHTQRNELFGTTRRVMHCGLAFPEEVAEYKKSFERKRKHVVEGGAWKPIPDAVWTFEDGRFIIEDSQIEVIQDG